jgi:succinate dehydrogenase / fumarate reductase, iron-sulfur subunit
MKIIPPHLAAEERQATRAAWSRYEAPNVSEHMSFLEMLDVLNEDLLAKGEEPVAFDHDCREGICGMCGCMVNGVAHGPLPRPRCASSTCAISRMATSCISSPGAPKRSRCQGPVVDRSAFDRIIAAGGFVSVATGSAPDGNAILIPQGQRRARHGRRRLHRLRRLRGAMCPNASASLFVSAKIAHLGLLPQGQPEREQRVVAMVAQATGGLRKLHQYRRMRGCLPQGHQARKHRLHESRVNGSRTVCEA